MIDRLPTPAEDLITWEFQVEKQGFITRYGRAGLEFYKQVVLQSGAAIAAPGVKRISGNIYELAKRQYTEGR